MQISSKFKQYVDDGGEDSSDDQSCVFPAQNCHRSNSEFRTVLEVPMPYLYKCQIHSHLGGLTVKGLVEQCSKPAPSFHEMPVW
jgi:hypothetical protein